MIFANSMSDLLQDAIPVSFILQVAATNENRRPAHISGPGGVHTARRNKVDEVVITRRNLLIGASCVASGLAFGVRTVGAIAQPVFPERKLKFIVTGSECVLHSRYVAPPGALD
jgi:protein gp37